MIVIMINRVNNHIFVDARLRKEILMFQGFGSFHDKFKEEILLYFNLFLKFD